MLIQRSVKLILELFAPRRCAGCGKSSEILCQECFNSSFKFGGSCVFCNFRNNTGKICRQCRNIDISKFRYIDKILWIGEYNNALKNSIKELKYKKRKELVGPLAELLYKKFLEFYPNYTKENFATIPIPMHPKKEHMRGYNQAELLAREFSKLSGIQLNADLLFKVADTKTQVETKTKEERIKNLDGAFKIKNDPSRAWVNKTIILIDDVATTGATFMHASQTIQKAFTSPPKILCLAIAHGYG